MDRASFERELVSAARSMTAEPTTGSTLDRAVQMCVELVASCDLAGICVFTSDGIEISAATHEHVTIIDELQQRLGEGPALTELRRSDVFTVGDLLDDPPWPSWAPRVIDDLGARSFAGFRLFADSDSIGVLNLYSFEPDAFSSQDVADGLVLAGHAAIAVSRALQRDELNTDVRTHQLIGEATGMLRERFALTTDQAFGVLARLAADTGTGLFAVAQHLVDTGSLPDVSR